MDVAIGTPQGREDSTVLRRPPRCTWVVRIIVVFYNNVMVNCRGQESGGDHAPSNAAASCKRENAAIWSSFEQFSYNSDVQYVDSEGC